MKAYELIADPKNWIQRAFAKDKNGNSIIVKSDDAFSWSFTGALLKVYDIEIAYSKNISASVKLRNRSVENWNDDPAHTPKSSRC